AGQPLPSERRLTEKLGASRTALREGLKLLRARGLIRTEQGKGSFVAPISQVDAGPLVHLFHSQPRTLYDLLEVRALLEGESARAASCAPSRASVRSWRPSRTWSRARWCACFTRSRARSTTCSRCAPCWKARPRAWRPCAAPRPTST